MCCCLFHPDKQTSEPDHIFLQSFQSYLQLLSVLTCRVDRSLQQTYLPVRKIAPCPPFKKETNYSGHFSTLPIPVRESEPHRKGGAREGSVRFSTFVIRRAPGFGRGYESHRYKQALESMLQLRLLRSLQRSEAIR